MLDYRSFGINSIGDTDELITREIFLTNTDDPKTLSRHFIVTRSIYLNGYMTESHFFMHYKFELLQLYSTIE